MSQTTVVETAGSRAETAEVPAVGRYRVLVTSTLASPSRSI